MATGLVFDWKVGGADRHRCGRGGSCPSVYADGSLGGSGSSVDVSIVASRSWSVSLIFIDLFLILSEYLVRLSCAHEYASGKLVGKMLKQQAECQAILVS